MPVPEWNYGDAYLRHPCDGGAVVFEDGSVVKAHDIFDALPGFMHRADLIFTDSPWNTGNLKSFYTKAGIDPTGQEFERFYRRLFECIAEIRPKTCYLEIGKEHLADYIIEMRKLYSHVTFYNSTYYHRPENRCYIVRGGKKSGRLKLDDVDEEDAIMQICRDEDYECVGDLCMGRGLVGMAAHSAGRRFVGTELNHKRLSVLVEAVSKNMSYYIDTNGEL
jgi:hypothetical protein